MSTNVGDAFFFRTAFGKIRKLQKHNFILRKISSSSSSTKKSEQASERGNNQIFDSIKLNKLHCSIVDFSSFQLISLRSSTAWSWIQASWTRRARQAQTIGILILSKRGNEREKKRKKCLLSTPIGRCYSTCFSRFFSFMLFASLPSMACHCRCCLVKIFTFAALLAVLRSHRRKKRVKKGRLLTRW